MAPDQDGEDFAVGKRHRLMEAMLTEEAAGRSSFPPDGRSSRVLLLDRVKQLQIILIAHVRFLESVKCILRFHCRDGGKAEMTY